MSKNLKCHALTVSKYVMSIFRSCVFLPRLSSCSAKASEREMNTDFFFSSALLVCLCLRVGVFNILIGFAG